MERREWKEWKEFEEIEETAKAYYTSDTCPSHIEREKMLTKLLCKPLMAGTFKIHC
jgi:hypothetical protein